MMQLENCLGRKTLKEENEAWELKSNQTRKTSKWTKTQTKQKEEQRLL